MASAGCGALDRPLSAPYCPTWFMLVTSVFQGNIATSAFHSTVAEPVLDINVNTLHWYVAVFDYSRMSDENREDKTNVVFVPSTPTDEVAWHTVFRCNVCRARAETHRLRCCVRFAEV
jgi:hypothetical protein